MSGIDRLQVIRGKIYGRDGGRCQYCGRGLTRKEAQADHLIPKARGGTKTLDNLVLCCEPCNQKKGCRTVAEVYGWPDSREWPS